MSYSCFILKSTQMENQLVYASNIILSFDRMDYVYGNVTLNFEKCNNISET